MTGDKIQTAIEEGCFFFDRMASGEKYEVSNRFNIALGSTHAVVIDQSTI